MDRLLLVAGMRGIGDVDPDDEAAAVVLGTGAGRTVMQGIRAWQGVLDDPPAEVRDAVAAFDPDERAWVVSALFTRSQQVAGVRSSGRAPTPGRPSRTRPRGARRAGVACAT